MCNPVGAIVRAIIAIYDLVMWLVDNIQRIISFVNSVVDSVAAIAAGQISGAANYIESSIARTIPMILSGLAQFLKLNGIAKKIQQAIEKVRKPIDNAIDKGIGFVVEKVKGWFGGNKKKTGKGDAKKIKDENKKDKAEELDPKDKAKHKEIAGKIESKLKKNKAKDKEEFKDFHKRVEKQGEALEDQYQPQLKKGINLDVKFKSVKEDEKDGDMDYHISIAPNTLKKDGNIDVDNAPKRGDHIFNHSLRKTASELANITKKLPSLSSAFSSAASAFSNPIFDLTVRKKGDREAGGDANSREYGAIKGQLINRFKEFTADIENNQEASPSALISLIQKWIGTSVDNEGIEYLDKKDKSRVTTGKNILEQEKNNIIQAINEVEKDPNSKSQNPGKEKARKQIEACQATLDSRIININSEVSQVEGLLKEIQSAQKAEIGEKLNTLKIKLQYLRTGGFTERIKNLRIEFGDANSIPIKNNEDIELVNAELDEILSEANKLLNEIKKV